MIKSSLHPTRLTLGTAQLGLRYGIANRAGRPDDATAAALLDRAWDLGIRSFDTARAYGDAEARLGGWLGDGHHEPMVISKLPRLAGDAGVPLRRVVIAQQQHLDAASAAQLHQSRALSGGADDGKRS